MAVCSGKSIELLPFSTNLQNCKWPGYNFESGYDGIQAMAAEDCHLRAERSKLLLRAYKTEIIPRETWDGVAPRNDNPRETDTNVLSYREH